MICKVKDCEREPREGNTLCDVCLIEMEVRMKEEMAKRLGRPPTEAEFDIFLDRVVANATARNGKSPL